MRRILFVDDEPLILEGLKSLLRPKRKEWEMTFLSSGQAALAELDKQGFDVVVTDMRMPQIDGATVLKHVQTKHPNAVRIVLSGHTEMEVALRTMPIAHQFLSKPCEAGTLQSAIDRACNLQSLLGDAALRSAVGTVGRLPSVPRLYLQISEALESATLSLKHVGQLIEQDVAVSAKILQVVNSGFLGLPKRITSIQHAVAYIGVNLLRRILLSIQAFDTFSERDLRGFSVERLQQHSLLTAKIAGQLVPNKRESEDAFTAGMLHDIGKLILATRPELGAGPVAEAVATQPPAAVVVDGGAAEITHGDIGAYLLGIWGLPYSVVEAVAFHHAPGRAAHETFDVVDAVYVANVLAKEQNGVAPSSLEGFDAEYLQKLGVNAMLPNWRRIAQTTRDLDTSARS